jgi:sporadic carbohydrate cluster protein (TIGR04323 family)
MKIVKGYIFSRPFFDERAPQHIQNIVIRNFCKQNALHFLLSASEYRMKNNYSILEDLLNNSKDFDGIVAYSLLMLPEKDTTRNRILNKLIRKKKFLSFAVEDITIKSIKDIKRINNLWKIKKTLKNTYFNYEN